MNPAPVASHAIICLGGATTIMLASKQGRVHHIGTFPQLEDQMTNFTSDIDRAAAG
jgi:phage terminase large subunit-like protein